MKSGASSRILIFIAMITLVFAGCGKKSPAPGTVLDEAMTAGRKADSFPAADEDYFKDMDGGIRTDDQRGQRTQ